MKPIKVYPTTGGKLCKTIEEYNVTTADEIIRPAIAGVIDANGFTDASKATEAVLAVVFGQRETFSALLHVVKKRKTRTKKPTVTTA